MIAELLRLSEDGEPELILREWTDPYTRVRLRRTAGGAWEWAEIDVQAYLALTEQSREAQIACAARVPYENPPSDESIALRPHLRLGHTVEESPESCVERQGYVFFGLGFYEGEGVDGIGGIGRYDTTTGEIEVRRPTWLRDKSVAHISDDGRFLWFSVWQQYEKDQAYWGLHRYDWSTDILERTGTTSSSPCGTRVAGVRRVRDELVVATDFGVSLLDLVRGEWSHLALEGKQLIERDCEQQIRSRLSAMIDGDCACAPDVLMESLVRTQPERLRRLMLEEPELRKLPLLAGFAPLARNFDEFEELLWSVVPPDSDERVRSHVASAFAATGDRSVAWRELVLPLARETGEWKLLAHFRGDLVVLDALVKAAEKPAHGPREQWVRGDAVEVIPWVGGSSSLPLLIELLRDADSEAERSADQFDRSRYLTELIRSTERVAHQRIERDGSITPLQQDSDRLDYALEEFTAALRFSYDVPALLEIIDQWLEWWDDRQPWAP